MKLIYITFLLLLCSCLPAQTFYNTIFTRERLRFDYVVTGNDTSISIYGYRLYREPYWGGSPIHLIDTLAYGDMFLEVYDSLTGKMIFSQGYSTLFKEWQTTDEARIKNNVFLETLLMPFPRSVIHLRLLNRMRDLQFKEIYSCFINPASLEINSLKQPAKAEVQLIDSSGLSADCADLVFIAEGYTIAQREKFFSDAKRFVNTLYSWEPYSKFPKAFNVYAVYIPSDEAGTDRPTDTIWVSTALGSSMNTFGSERYLTVTDVYHLHDIIAGVPYDQICVLVNSDKYAGGGIYNFFTVFTVDNINSEFLFHHEFGHAFASLADEYYTSSVAYTEAINFDVEPYQPNITTKIEFDKKWKNMISDTIPVPTPDTSIYAGVVGLFEGAAYCAKGIYRPARDCSMKSVVSNAFCPVCREAIIRMIYLSGYRKQE
jgi:hypothetical protein